MTKNLVPITQFLTNFDAARVPVRAVDREPGTIPYLGASGTVDHVAGWTHEGDYLCISEDGENLRSRQTPIAWTQRGRFWANNHVHVLGGVSLKRLRFFAAAVAVTDISGALTGSTQPKLTQRALDQILIPEFDASAQTAIGEVLGALDDKIAANKAVVELCDQLRHTYWKQLTTKATTEQPLSELAQFVNGRAFTKNADGKGRMVVRIAELNTGPGASTVYSSIDAPENHTVSAGELLMSWSGSLRTARWFRDDAIVNQHIFKVIPTAPDTEWAVESAIDTLMPTFRSIAADKATTMGHIKREHLDFKVRWPRLTGGQQALGASVWRRALQAEVENEVLARTRDELLPLLMNGTITVREAEDRTKEVP